MSSPDKSSSQSGTFYNLQNKRTLPREVLKWMQGLDLSYSVKDFRKDMSNGFLIGQIISRYQPGKIPMHAFENSQNNHRRDNNWNQLALFFKKYTIRDIHIGPDEYTNILKNLDPKSQQMFQFICRLYTICTKRVLPENAPILDLPPTQSNNPNLTASYLLKEDGLQKLDNSGVLGSSPNNSHFQPEHKNDQKLQDRLPTRKIVPNLDNHSNMVDVLGVGLRSDNRKMTSKRKSWEAAKEDSNYSEENGESQKLIFDYLNEIIQECIPMEDHALRELLVSESSKYKATESLRKSLPNIDQQFLCNFLNQIQINSSELVSIILRELNDTWKFFTYFIKMLRHYNYDSQQFTLLTQLLSHYAKAAHTREPKRLHKVFSDSLLTNFISEVTAAKEWLKKQKIMTLLYDFEGRQLTQKKSALSKLKETMGSHNPIYIEWLAVLVREETQVWSNTNNKLIDDFIYYAHQYLPSSVTTMRTSALKIFHQISKTQCHTLIQDFFYQKAIQFQSSRCDPEQMLLLILIFSNLMKQLVNSKDYQNLIKGNNTNNLIKVYNPDNEKNMEDLKKKMHLLGETIHKMFNACSDITVREICARIAINFISQSRLMLHIFLEFITLMKEKQEFLKAEANDYHLKSMKYTCQNTNQAIIQEYSNEILTEIISLLVNGSSHLTNFMFLINTSLQFLNIKKVNMEFWEDISLHIVKPYTQMIRDPVYAQEAFSGINCILSFYFNFDMKIRQLNDWVANAVALASKEGIPEVLEQIKQFNATLNNQYEQHHNESVRTVIEEMSEILNSKGITGVIQIGSP